ncbi:MAG: zinc-binding alcohol dehydrogenase family protein [Verrucomicrobiia bacterium]|mgnify:FL=1|tara:strand:- start:1640 stop:2644 length:1005 start_codon:yes stop_codon:yes gene_type:complete
MKAIQFQPGASLDQPNAALEVELPTPTAEGHDILVKIEAVGMNPVDTKVRPGADGEPKTLGFDAAGTVAAIGDAVTLFKVGDSVYYAGDITRPGSNADFQLVDERIAGIRPKSLDADASAALPLTSLTAWESLFDRLHIDPEADNAGQSILIIGGAGGVGSMGIQLAKLAGLTVIATASRDESAAWCKELGADHVVNHRESIPNQLKAIDIPQVNYIANFNNTENYWNIMGEVIAPQGRIVLIVEQVGTLDIGGPYKLKSVSVSWELMFTRSLFKTSDIAQQHAILTRIAELIDTGKIKCTANEAMAPLNVENIIKAHTLLESGKSIGKLTIKR